MKQKVKGWEELQRQLEAIAEADYLPALEKGVRKAILPEMQSLTAVDTGELLDSEGVEVIKDTVVLFANSDHAVFVEFGTIHQSAQPYMRPAIDTRSDEAMRIAAEEAELIIQKAVR